MTAPDPAAMERRAAIEDRQVAVCELLTDLGALVELVERLTTTRQRGLGFLTATGRHALDQLLTTERLERRGNPDRVDDTGRPVVGLDWLNRDLPIAGTGDVASAGTFPAIAVDAVITFTLHHLIRRITQEVIRAGLCPLARAPGEPTTLDLLDHLRNLTWTAPSPSLLDEVATDLEYLRVEVTRVVDGNDRVVLPDPCPHCGRNTLVVTFRDGEIRCDRDPGTGHYAPCTCPNAYCPCKRTPVSHRHTWHRERGTSADGWWALADRLNLTRRGTT